MKIAFLLGSLGRGGTETLILDVFRNITSKQFGAVGFYRKPDVLENEFLKCNSPMIYLPLKNNYLAYLKQLRRELIKNQINVVHAQQPVDAFHASLACIGTSIPVVLTLHGYDFNQDLFWKTILRLILPFTKRNFFVSNTQKSYFTEKYNLIKTKQVLVYNGISFKKFAKVESPKILEDSNFNLKNGLKLNSDTIILGCVGNFNSVRDQFTLCRFIKILKEQFTNFHFVFIGGCKSNATQYYDKCIEYCDLNNLNSFVTFLGIRNDVPQLLAQFDAFLYATDYDTFGIGVVEAMATQIPVFVNDWGVMNEITDNGKYATLYKTKDENDLLKQFILFLHDKTHFIQKASNASAFVMKKYSIENHIECLKNEYEVLIKK